MKEKNKLTRKQAIGYGLGDCGGVMTFALMGSTFSMYCTDALGIDPKTMAELLKRIQDKDKMEDIPKDLPVLITAGKEDPVGGYGEAPKRLFAIYTNELKMTNVELKLYDEMRHELQQEIGREKVYADQYDWIKKVLDSGSTNN